MTNTSPSAGSGSYTALRVLAGVVGLPLTIYALLVIAGLLFAWRFDPIGLGLAAAPGTAGLLCGWFALRGHVAESRARMRFALIGGLVLGGIGFVAGFFGPLVLWPEANQGPLIGIFVTGPLGFVLGVAAGWLVGLARANGARRL